MGVQIHKSSLSTLWRPKVLREVHFGPEIGGNKWTKTYSDNCRETSSGLAVGWATLSAAPRMVAGFCR